MILLSVQLGFNLIPVEKELIENNPTSPGKDTKLFFNCFSINGVGAEKLHVCRFFSILYTVSVNVFVAFPMHILML